VTITRGDAISLDAADELRTFVDEFVPADAGPDGRPIVYLDGNSLGRPPKRTVQRLHDVLHTEWASSLIRSWDAHERVSVTRT